jgi:hypothetical protein
MEEKLNKLEDRKFYWVRCFEKDKWEVASYRKSDSRFKFTDGGHKEAKYVFDFKETALEPPSL